MKALDQRFTQWLRSEGDSEKTEFELSQAVKIFQAPQPAIRFVRTYSAIIIIAIVCICGLVAASIFTPTTSNGSRDPFTTAVMALKNRYKMQPVVEFGLLDYATDMHVLNITLRKQSKNSMIKDIDSWKFISEVNLKYQTEYIMQQTKYSDSNKHKRLRIMISGLPGAGKTTLMRHIAKEWAEGRSLQACEMLILIHLDRLATEQKPQSLSQLLQISPLHDRLNNVEEVSKEIQEKEGAGVCFLFDSIDRWPHRDDFVHDLFFDSDLRFSLCISTARQIHTFREQLNIMYFGVLGFNEQDLNDHLHALTSDQQVISSIETLWDSDGDIKDLCKLPLHMVMLFHITNLNIEQTVSLHTKTQLYSAFINWKIQYNSDLLSGWNTLSLKDCILLKEGSKQCMKPETIGPGPASKNELCTAFQHLHGVAFDMLIQKKYKFPERVEINKNINKSGFVDVTKVKSIHNEVKYTFHHPTFVEFFAAIHLLSLPQEERLYLYIKEQQSKRPVNHNINLWLFFFGLLGEDYNKNDYSNIIRQFAMYHSEQEIEQFPPYCQKGRFLEYLKEIHWKGKKFSKLLSLAGVVENSTLFTPCGDKPDISLKTLLYTLEHDTNIHVLRFDNIGKFKSDIDTLLMLEANMWVTFHHQLDVLHSRKPLNLYKLVSYLLHTTIESNSATADSVVDNILNLFFQINITTQQNSKLQAVFQKGISDLFSELKKYRSENYSDFYLEYSIMVRLKSIATNLLEGLLFDNTIIELQEGDMHHHSIRSTHVRKGVSTYIHVHTCITLRDQANLHESKINWLNANSIVDYMLSGNILSNLLWQPLGVLHKTIVKQVLSSLLEAKHNLEMIRPMLYQTVNLIKLFHTTHEFWESLKTLLSHLDSLHLNSVELSCDDFPKLIDQLKQKKNHIIRYVFDLNIDLGMTQDVSDSCRKLMSSLNVLISANIELQKLTVIFPKQYFGTPRSEFIPRQLQLTGLKHLSIHLPESLRESNCYKFIDEVSKFKELITLEIQGCPLSHPKLKVKTRLPDTLRELTLGRSNITDEDVSAVVILINSKHNLTSLSLPNNSITGSGLKSLVKELKCRRNFTLLDLSGNLIAEKDGLETLSELSNLRELRLSNCSIGDKELEMLVTSLESNSNLRSLNLSRNPFIESEHGLEPLARLTNLHHLDISGSQHRHGHCHVEFDKGCIEHHTLIKVLKKLTQLRFLNLCSKNDPPIYWSKEMASVISQLPHLQVFNAPCLSFVDYDE